jgi:hypothetical protein
VRRKALARDPRRVNRRRAGFSILKPRRAKELGYMTEKEQKELKEEKKPKEAKKKKEAKGKKELEELKEPEEKKELKEKKEPEELKEPEEKKEPKEKKEAKEKKEVGEKPLDRMTAKELREVALGLEGIVGVHAMNKSELLAAVKKAKGIVDDKKRQTSVDVRTIKGKIRELRSQKEAIKEAGDKKKMKILRRRINRLKKKTRRVAMAG